MIVLSAGGAIGALLAQQYAAIGFAAFSLLGVYMIMQAGSFQFDHQGISHKNMFGFYGIQWDQVKRIEMAPDLTVIFHGDNGAFVLSPPGSWSGAQKNLAYEFVARKIDEIGIPVDLNKAASIKSHKNVRIRNER